MVRSCPTLNLISTHAPLAGRDVISGIPAHPSAHFNPRAPCGARPFFVRFLRRFDLFQPTRPLRGATSCACTCHRAARISTHAPLAGRDGPWMPCLPCSPYFNPRAPCGARRRYPAPSSLHRLFQPTRPLRGATSALARPAAGPPISTHAPLAGRDHLGDRLRRDAGDFNPRAPCGARPVMRSWMFWMRPLFQPTRPLRGATPQTSSPSHSRPHFNPRAPCGARLPQLP